MHKNSVKFGCAVSEICERADKETDRQTYSSQYYMNVYTSYKVVFIE